MLRAVHGGFEGIAAIPARAFFSRSDNGANLSGAVEDPERVAASLEDINISFRIDSDCSRINQRRIDGFVAVLWDTFFPIAGDCRHDAGFQINHANTAIIEVSEVKFVRALGQGRTI